MDKRLKRKIPTSALPKPGRQSTSERIAKYLANAEETPVTAAFAAALERVKTN